MQRLNFLFTKEKPQLSKSEVDFLGMETDYSELLNHSLWCHEIITCYFSKPKFRNDGGSHEHGNEEHDCDEYFALR